MSLVKPLIGWGSPQDLSAWSDFNTPAVTSSIADPFGGTGAYTLDDNNAAAVEGKSKTTTFLLNGTQYVSVFAKAGTATGFGFGIYDNTAAAYRGYVDYTWSGGTWDTISGSVTTYTPILVGSSWYLFRFAVPSIVAANTNHIRLYGAKTTVTLTGTTLFYMRDVALVPEVDVVIRRRKKRAGHEVVQGASGIEDAWDAGDDYCLGADIRHIPDHDENNPANCSGFDGLNELAGVNCGWDAMLKAGQAKTTLLWVPDRADCSTYTSSYMVEPMEDGIALEANNANYRTFHLELRNTVAHYAGWTS